MPPERYTTVTISDEIAAKLAELVVTHELESVAKAIDFAADAAQDPEILPEAELTRLLYRKLAN